MRQRRIGPVSTPRPYAQTSDVESVENHEITSEFRATQTEKSVMDLINIFRFVLAGNAAMFTCHFFCGSLQVEDVRGPLGPQIPENLSNRLPLISNQVPKS